MRSTRVIHFILLAIFVFLGNSATTEASQRHRPSKAQKRKLRRLKKKSKVRNRRRGQNKSSPKKSNTKFSNEQRQEMRALLEGASGDRLALTDPRITEALKLSPKRENEAYGAGEMRALLELAYNEKIALNDPRVTKALAEMPTETRHDRAAENRALKETAEYFIPDSRKLTVIEQDFDNGPNPETTLEAWRHTVTD